MNKYSRHHLRSWRRHRGLTQEMLAEQIGKVGQTIWRYENYKCALRQDTLDALAKVLETSRSAILDTPPPPR